MKSSIYAIGIPLVLSLISNTKGSANQEDIIRIISDQSIVNRYRNMIAENILKAYNDYTHSRILQKNTIYDHVVGSGLFSGDHKEKMFNYKGKIRPFNFAWNNNKVLNNDSTWSHLFTINPEKKGKYDYKMYISIIHDLNPEQESMQDIVKAIGSMGRFFYNYKDKYPNNYLSAKTVGKALTLREHYDNFVVYTDSPKIIEEICADFNSGTRQEINKKLKHTYILSPEERKNVFMRGTLGIDANAPNKNDTQTDSLILTDVIINFLDFVKQKGNRPTKHEVIKIMNTWADFSLKQKINFVENKL